MATDLQTLRKSIKELNKRRSELKAIMLTTSSFTRKEEILDQMDLVSLRRAKLETFLHHLEAAMIQVGPPNATDKVQMKSALEKLSIHVAKDMQWRATVKVIRGVLSAAQQIRSNLDGRQLPANA